IARCAIQARNHFQRSAFDYRANTQLDRLLLADAGADVEEVLAQEVEHAAIELAGNDLLLVGNVVHDFQRGGVHQAQVDGDAHDIHAAANAALDALGSSFAAIGADIVGADVKVELGNAADNVIVGAGHRTGENF